MPTGHPRAGAELEQEQEQAATALHVSQYCSSG